MNPRALAVEVLARVEATDAYLNRVLEERLAGSPPHASRDAAFVTELCYGATRRRLALDFALAKSADRRLETLEDRVLAALRVGVYQAFFMRVPARAAVAETVEALKTIGLSRAAGFANAVLRKVVATPQLPLPPETDWLARSSVQESHPAWLVGRWERAHGRERTLAMLQADNRAPPLCVRANSTRVTRDALLFELADTGLSVRPSERSPSGVVIESPGRLDALFGYSEGRWQVQDEAAQLVLHHAVFPEGGRIWDACAAPGGKACQLAERHEVLATDLHANKLPRIEGEAKRLGVRARLELRAHDATQPLPPGLGPFEGVLLDAPCSGLGTLRRHPELRYRRKEADIARLAELQAELLGSVQAHVKPGGLLVYSVCSTEPEEGSEQIARFLAGHPDFQREPGPALTDPAREGTLQTLPGTEDWDGFFAARLRRRGPG